MHAAHAPSSIYDLSECCKVRQSDCRDRQKAIASWAAKQIVLFQIWLHYISQGLPDSGDNFSEPSA